MTESLNAGGSFDQIEEMVRAAGDYVQVSENLRPCVLESARTIRSEWRARRWIGRVAAAFFVFAFVFGLIGQQMRTSGGQVGSEEVFALAEAKVSRGAGDIGWCVVEAFKELRSRQTKPLHPPG